jgi:hypothetical protein
MHTNRLSVTARVLTLVLLGAISALALPAPTLRLAAALKATPDGRPVRAGGNIVWQLIDQASIISGNLRANVPDGTVWQIYMRASPQSLEPLYVGQATFTGGRAQFATCSYDAQAGYYVTVFDENFTVMLDGTFN